MLGGRNMGVENIMGIKGYVTNLGGCCLEERENEWNGSVVYWECHW